MRGMYPVTRISTHWPLDQLLEIVRAKEPGLVVEFRPTPGNPGEQWYWIDVEADNPNAARLLGPKVLEALKGIPSGNDRTGVYAPQ